MRDAHCTLLCTGNGLLRFTNIVQQHACVFKLHWCMTEFVFKPVTLCATSLPLQLSPGSRLTLIIAVVTTKYSR